MLPKKSAQLPIGKISSTSVNTRSSRSKSRNAISESQEQGCPVITSSISICSMKEEIEEIYSDNFKRSEQREAVTEQIKTGLETCAENLNITPENLSGLGIDKWCSSELENVKQIVKDKGNYYVRWEIPEYAHQDILYAILYKLCIQQRPILISTPFFQTHRIDKTPITINDLCNYYKADNSYPEAIHCPDHPGNIISYDILKFVLVDYGWGGISQSELWKYIAMSYNEDDPDERKLFGENKISNIIIRNIIYGYWLYISLKNWGVSVLCQEGIKTYTGFRDYNYFKQTVDLIESGQITSGKRIMNTAFTSCSTDIEVSTKFGDYIFEILFTSGSKLTYIQHVAQGWNEGGCSGEHEILLNVGILIEYIDFVDISINGKRKRVYRFKIVSQTDFPADNFIEGGSKLIDLLTSNLRTLYGDEKAIETGSASSLTTSPARIKKEFGGRKTKRNIKRKTKNNKKRNNKRKTKRLLKRV